MRLDDSAAPLLLTQSYLLAKLQQLGSDISRIIVCIDTLNLDQQPKDNPIVGRQASDLAYVIYTSGSTGKPKGAMNAHAGIVNRLLWMQETFQLTGSDRVLQKTPCSFDVSIWEFFWPLITGAALVVAKPEGHKDPSYLAALVAEQQITTLHFVPSMLPHFIDHADLRQCRSLKRLMCSGEALSADLNRRFFTHFADQHITLHNLYGPTEAAIDVSHWSCHSDDTCIPIGKPIANTRLHVLDANNQPLPIGIAGELCIAGIQVGLGYLNRPELTAEKFIHVDLYGKSECIYKTGDLAKWHATGNVEYLRRMDNQVKLRGFRIELGEIESVLLQRSEVKEVVVIVSNTRAEHQQLIAYVVTGVADTAQAVLTDTLKACLLQTLPDYMLPTAFVYLRALPLTPNGKIDHKALPEPRLRQNQYLYPRDALELQLIQLWETLFDSSPVGVLDDFFDLGGDSLLAIRLVFAIKEKMGFTLPLPSLFQHRTVERLAILLREDYATPPWSPLVCLQPDGAKKPLFFIHASGGSAFDHLYMARDMGKDRPFYALHPRGIEAGESFHDCIEEMAADYVAAIRKVQPTGPYLLGGWSFGGMVGFEMARLLEAAGETVPILMMIDTPAIGAVLYHDDDVKFLLDRLPHYHNMQLDELDVQSSPTDQMAYMLNEIKLSGLFTPDIDAAYAQNWFDLYKQHNMLVAPYKPARAIRSNIVFYKPAEKTPFDTQMGDAITSWRAFTHDGIEVQEAQGNHFNMISPANTKHLVAQMQKSLLLLDM